MVDVNSERPRPRSGRASGPLLFRATGIPTRGFRSCALLGAARVEPDRPGIDRVDPEMRLAPGIAREGGSDLVLRVGLDRVHHAVLVGERTAQDDEAGVHQPVHEGRVLGPTRLLLEWPRRVPLRAGAEDHDVEHRHDRANLSGEIGRFSPAISGGYFGREHATRGRRRGAGYSPRRPGSSRSAAATAWP